MIQLFIGLWIKKNVADDIINKKNKRKKKGESTSLKADTKIMSGNEMSGIHFNNKEGTVSEGVDVV